MMLTSHQKRKLIARARHIRNDILDLQQEFHSIGADNSSMAATRVLLKMNNLELSIHAIPEVDKS